MDRLMEGDDRRWNERERGRVCHHSSKRIEAIE
jgi:hypothetical protein